MNNNPFLLRSCAVKKRKFPLQIVFFVIIPMMLVIIDVIYQRYSAFTQMAQAASSDTYIKWVDFNVSTQALKDAYKYDVDSYGTDAHASMSEILAYLCSKNGNNFDSYNTSSFTALTDRLRAGETMSEISAGLKLYSYYYESMEAVVGGFVGEYETVSGEKKYGLKVFSPIAEGYYYNHYDDFGASRSFGFKREHLGHDLMGSVGTPVIAVESGYVEAIGWNPYGGWRIGIRSFDGKRYYYYAHLRKNHPYTDMHEGKIVNAGEVIGYLGMTGYSTKENTNNISTPHLHYGLQLIFDKSQKDGNNQIWIDMYALTDFLRLQKASVVKDSEANEYYSTNSIVDSNAPD
ncbi:MAG: M23 family metallopeptidase [Clostridia bacterium]|nr:M23 family metallopeptidase [Clostridia bacterium]